MHLTFGTRFSEPPVSAVPEVDHSRKGKRSRIPRVDPTLLQVALTLCALIILLMPNLMVPHKTRISGP